MMGLNLPGYVPYGNRWQSSFSAMVRMPSSCRSRSRTALGIFSSGYEPTSIMFNAHSFMGTTWLLRLFSFSRSLSATGATCPLPSSVKSSISNPNFDRFSTRLDDMLSEALPQKLQKSFGLVLDRKSEADADDQREGQEDGPDKKQENGLRELDVDAQLVQRRENHHKNQDELDERRDDVHVPAPELKDLVHHKIHEDKPYHDDDECKDDVWQPRDDRAQRR